MNSRLPHRSPLLFAQGRLANHRHQIETEVYYDTPPTLEQFIEGAAQSCAFFDEDIIPTARWGYLAQVKRCMLKIETPPTRGAYRMQMHHEMCFGVIHQISFTVTQNRQTIATGTLQVALQEESS